MKKQEMVVQRLRALEVLRREVRTLEEALQALTPEERMVAQLLLICPQKGNAKRLCGLLGMEESTVYRRRRQVLRKLEEALFGGGQCV